MEKRPRYLDTVFSILIILYIFFQLNIWPDFVSNLVRSLAKELILPGFFMAEGAALYFEHSYQKKEKTYLRDCFQRYLLLYFIFSGIGLFIRLLSCLSGFGNVSDLQLKLQLFDTLNFNGFGLLWIFPVLFIVMIVYGNLRSSLSYTKCLLISLALFVFSYFANDIWLLIDQREISVKQYFLKLSMPLWRACGFMLFTSLGEGLEMLLQKRKNQKVFFGVMGIVLMAAGFLLAGLNEKNIVLKEMQYGNIYLSFIEFLLIGTGIYMIARWIGQLGILELLGRNWYILFLSCDTFFLLSATNIIGNDIFNAFKNNFLTGLVRLVCYVILLSALMLFWENHIRKYWNNKTKE